MPPFVKWLKVFIAFFLGMGYAFGPESYSSSPTFAYAQQTPFGVRGWGAIFILCAVLLAWTQVSGKLLSAVIWMIWGVLLIASSRVGLLTSLGAAAWPFFFASLNAGEVWLWLRPYWLNRRLWFRSTIRQRGRR